MKSMETEFQEENEALLEEIHRLSRELLYHNLIIDSFIPAQFQEMIERSIKWNHDLGEWSLQCLAYAGNNLNRQHQ